MAGLKSAYGGSIPPFLGIKAELERKLALQMCDRGEGIREVILRLLLLALLIQPLV